MNAPIEIRIDGNVYPCPFSGSFRRHSRDEYEAILASVHEYGIQTAVRLYNDVDLGLTDCVLDGQGRMSALAELGGGSFPNHHHGNLTTERAYTLAKILNDARRHERTREEIDRRAQEQAEARAERVVKVAEARAEGQTVREVAATVGVGVATAHRDIEKAKELGLIPTEERERDQPGAGEPDEDADPDGELDTSLEATGETVVDVPTPVPDRPAEPAEQPVEVATRHEDHPDDEWVHPADPAHPFADILNKMRALSGAVTKAIAKGDEYGLRLNKFLLEVQTAKLPQPALILPRAIIKGAGDDKKHLKNQFIGLRPLGRVIRLAGLEKDSKSKTVIKEFLDPPEDRK